MDKKVARYAVVFAEAGKVSSLVTYPTEQAAEDAGDSWVEMGEGDRTATLFELYDHDTHYAGPCHHICEL